MRSPAVAFAFLVCFALPQTPSAEGLTPRQPREAITGSSLRSQLSELVQRLGVIPISKAHAAECAEEGEICTSNEQCCPGLQCAGGPPATCTTED
jgi:hypothetical protein